MENPKLILEEVKQYNKLKEYARKQETKQEIKKIVSLVMMVSILVGILILLCNGGI